MSLGFRFAALLSVVMAGAAVSAEDGPLPTCRPSVPVPPPEPPARPDDLTAKRPPLVEAPLPPQRPAELPSVPPRDTGAPQVPAASPPLELRIDPAPAAERPTCVPTLQAPPPPSRPAELMPRPAGPSDVPVPPARPPELDVAPAGDGPPEDVPRPPVRPAELSGDEIQKPAMASPEDLDCLRRLDGLGVAYTKAEPITNGQCTVPHPLTVTKLGNGLSVGASEIMTCRLAEGLARWTAQARQSAETELGDTLTGLTLGGTYVCRGQNHGSEAPLSEHSFANAADVAGFTFAKHAPILVGPLPEGSKEAAFLNAVRTKACESFTTVLGPGTDEQHANHLHLDQRERKAGYRICQ